MEKSKLLKIPEYLKIISDTNRMSILVLLKQKPLCVCEIMPQLGLSQNLISHHLKVLKDFELLNNSRDGTKIIYSRNEKVINNYQLELNKKII